MKNLVFILLATMSVFTLSAQDVNSKKSQKVVIKTSAECGDCKEKIEEKLNYTKGIVFSELDYETKELTVKFKPNLITLEEIKKILSEMGYDADELKANENEQKKLPLCCQPGGMSK
jgi:periplasmic mercuric ion binding protein